MSETIDNDGHRIYLTALIKQEQNPSYQRHDYLSYEWQLDLWQDEIRATQAAATGVMMHHDNFGIMTTPTPSSADKAMASAPRQSPSSVIISPIAPSPYNNHSVTPVVGPGPSEICIRWREKIVEWKYQVVDRFELSRELVSVSTFYLDQYLSMNYVDEELFQLVAMASIYLAIKIHSPKKVTIRSIASTGNGRTSIQHIEAMELSIMKCLNWHLFPPTCVTFIENFFPLISREVCSRINNGDNTAIINSSSLRMGETLEFARFLAELSVCAYPFVSAKPSSVAIAAILYSFEHYRLPHEAREAFQDLIRGLPSLDVHSTEVAACEKLLRKVYELAMPNDMPFFG